MHSLEQKTRVFCQTDVKNSISIYVLVQYNNVQLPGFFKEAFSNFSVFISPVQYTVLRLFFSLLLNKTTNALRVL